TARSSSTPLRPRTSTSFPYTTLFRSANLMHVLLKNTPDPPPGMALRTIHGTTPKRYLPALRLKKARRTLLSNDGAATSPTEVATDRKSTRLNSSHQIISYAVFCLKKK